MCKTKNLIVLCCTALLSVLTISSCRSNSSYSKLLKEEKKLIDNYVSRNNLEIVDYEPTAEQFAANPKLYYAYPGTDRFYFRLEKAGETDGDSIRVSQKVYVRYKQYDLTEYPDTASNWSILDSPNAIEFNFWSDMYSGRGTSCTAWNYAIRLMKYNNSECTIIVPSKLGFESEQSTVTPYGYMMRIMFHP